jgi:hypothetical protein
MPNYGLCCEGDGCKMRVNKMVTFHHVCVNCNQFLHLICGVVNENDQLYCNKCASSVRNSPTNNFETLPDTAEETVAEEQAGASSDCQNTPTSGNEMGTSSNLQNTSGSSYNTRNTPGKAKSSSAPPKTTSRKKQKSQGGEARIGVGKRVKIERSNLYHILKTSEQRQCLPHGIASNYCYFGTVVAGGGVKTAKKGWDVMFDVLPAGDNIVGNITRSKLTVLAPGDEESAEQINNSTQAEVMEEIMREDKVKLTPATKSQKEFMKLSDETLKAATSFAMFWGKGNDDFVLWEILSDTDYITDNNFKPPDTANVIDPKFDFATDDIARNFFQYVFPSIVGHAKIIDKYLSDQRAPYFETVQNDKIVFYDPDDPDPDWKVKNCYLLLIAAATEVENGIENLWKRGRVGNRRYFPDFGKFMAINEMKAFCSAAPYCWAEEEFWYLPQRDTPWDVFLPCLTEWNNVRKNLVRAAMILIDESMSGWHPKTSKLGGLPNYTYEPRKPVPLGTMFRNGAECLSGIIVHQDVVQMSEVQSRKKYFNDKSSLPGDVFISAHAAEVLRQVEGAKLPVGGWVGGDSWFGSILSAVEVYLHFGVHSTWVIKQNYDYFPVGAMKSILKARYGKKPAGHWVVFRTKISEVPLIAIAYAWSHTSTSFFISTCGSTHPASTSYETHFEDEFGVIKSKMIARPHLLEWVYDFLPLIDEHNKQRQSLLHLEKKWPTKNCWFRLLITLLGMSVVDLYRVYLNHDKQKYKAFTILEFSDMICRNLRLRDTRKAPTAAAVAESHFILTNSELALERITNAKGEIAQQHPSKYQQEKERRSKGGSITANCYICRKYIPREGANNYKTTSFCCKNCKMPLCMTDRSNSVRMSCYNEHKTTTDPDLGCTQQCKRNYRFPKSKMIILPNHLN